MIKNFSRYALEIIIDGALGIILGILVDKIATSISRKLGLSYSMRMILQILLIITVLYLMKIDSKYLYEAWQGGDANYGIVFVALFLASQKNLARFLEDIYHEE